MVRSVNAHRKKTAARQVFSHQFVGAAGGDGNDHLVAHLRTTEARHKRKLESALSGLLAAPVGDVACTTPRKATPRRNVTRDIYSFILISNDY